MGVSASPRSARGVTREIGAAAVELGAADSSSIGAASVRRQAVEEQWLKR